MIWIHIIESDILMIVHLNYLLGITIKWFGSNTQNWWIHYGFRFIFWKVKSLITITALLFWIRRGFCSFDVLTLTMLHFAMFVVWTQWMLEVVWCLLECPTAFIAKILPCTFTLDHPVAGEDEYWLRMNHIFFYLKNWSTYPSKCEYV